MMLKDDRPHKPGDGRFAHSARSRERILQAWVDIDREGDKPTVDRIVAIANVSRQSFYRLTSFAAVREAGLERWLANQGVTTLEEAVAYEHALAVALRDEAEKLAGGGVARPELIVRRMAVTVAHLERVGEVRQRWAGQEAAT